MGMVAEMSLHPFDGMPQVIALLQAIGMPTALPGDFTPAALWEVMLQDKKNVAGRVRLAIPQDLGCGQVVEMVREKFLVVLS
jgi:3-dehydroquinate synthase